MTPELKKAVQKKAQELFGKRKGAVSSFVEMVLRNHLNLKEKE